MVNIQRGGADYMQKFCFILHPPCPKPLHEGMEANQGLGARGKELEAPRNCRHQGIGGVGDLDAARNWKGRQRSSAGA